MKPLQIRYNIGMLKGTLYFQQFPKYKGFHYRYDEDKNIWQIYDDYICGNLFTFNADKYRIDECFDYVLNNIKFSKSIIEGMSNRKYISAPVIKFDAPEQIGISKNRKGKLWKNGSDLKEEKG